MGLISHEMLRLDVRYTLTVISVLARPFPGRLRIKRREGVNPADASPRLQQARSSASSCDKRRAVPSRTVADFP
jgi:hypothetical protein